MLQHNYSIHCATNAAAVDAHCLPIGYDRQTQTQHNNVTFHLNANAHVASSHHHQSHRDCHLGTHLHENRASRLYHRSYGRIEHHLLCQQCCCPTKVPKRLVRCSQTIARLSSDSWRHSVTLVRVFVTYTLFTLDRRQGNAHDCNLSTGQVHERHRSSIGFATVQYRSTRMRWI